MKGFRVTKIVKEIKFEEVRGELESRKSLQRQSVTEYLKLTLVFVRNDAQREGLDFCFSRVFC